jgi:hypothetical protein
MISGEAWPCVIFILPKSNQILVRERMNSVLKRPAESNFLLSAGCVVTCATDGTALVLARSAW